MKMNVDCHVTTKDNDGHSYEIPLHLLQSFVDDRNAICFMEEGSDEWYDANDDFDVKYRQFMVG